jgi:carboxylate-amine ligase
LVRHLVEQTDINADLSAIGLAIAVENKWRAQRYGTAVNFVDHQSMQAKPIAIVLEDLLERLADDTEALSCTSEIAHARIPSKRGSSADEQLKVYGNARMEDRSRQAALKDVVGWLCKETTSGIG